MPKSRINVNLSSEVESMVSNLCNLEWSAQQAFLSMALHYRRDDVALVGYAKFFEKYAQDSKKNAKKYGEFLIKRGGILSHQDIEKPSKDKLGSPLEGLEAALQTRKAIHRDLLELHKKGHEGHDPHLTGWLEEDLISSEVDSIFELSHLITRQKRLGTGLGEIILDKELRKELDDDSDSSDDDDDD